VSAVVVAPLLVALGTAVLALGAGGAVGGRLVRAVSVLGGVAYAATVAVLVRRVALPLGSNAPLVHAVGGWQPPFGIVLVADALSAFLLALAAVVFVPVLAYAVVAVDDYGQRLSFHPLVHLMMAGVTGSLLTGDLFNLFVWFEVMLMASYILVGFYSGPTHTRAALYYVVLNLVGSAVMLLAVGGLYATTGTLNMADMARRLADPAAYGVSLAPTLGLLALLVAVFALKAGLVPFHAWVPAAYRAAPAPVTALLAGVVKKVGLYAVVRVGFTVFGDAPLVVSLPGVAGESALAFLGPVLFVLAVASVLFGGVAAVSRPTVEGVLAHSSISQIGFVFLPLAVAATVPEVRALGVTAALVYAFNHGLAKSGLFLVAGTLQDVLGTTQFGDLGGVARRAPVLSAGFLVFAFGLVGTPPLAGFLGKLLVFDTAARAVGAGGAGAALALATALAGAVLTIAYYTRAWRAGFWGDPSATVRDRLPVPGPAAGPEPAPDAATDGGRATGALVVRVGAVVTLALAVVGFGVGGEALVAAAQGAAEAALDTGGYVDAVGPVEGIGS
jgi:multicomponent Na+:H+ antiporter subunit D